MKFQYAAKTKMEEAQETVDKMEAKKRLEAQINNAMVHGENRVTAIVLDEVEYNILKETDGFKDMPPRPFINGDKITWTEVGKYKSKDVYVEAKK